MYLSIRTDDALQLVLDEEVERVNMLFDQALDLQESREQVPLVFLSIDRIGKVLAVVERFEHGIESIVLFFPCLLPRRLLRGTLLLSVILGRHGCGLVCVFGLSWSGTLSWRFSDFLRFSISKAASYFVEWSNYTPLSPRLRAEAWSLAGREPLQPSSWAPWTRMANGDGRKHTRCMRRRS